ncbi:MAG: potassium channel family protein, partial [Bacteroidales bacterium]|nr:potassium channel family protein [Bacteroidales bacterium]
GSGRVNFNRSVFGKGDVSFEGCEHKEGKISMKRAKFESGLLSFEQAEMGNIELSFDKTDFGENSVSFYNGQFQTLSFQQCHLDHYTDLRVKRCYSIDLSNTIIRDIIDLKPFEFDEEITKIYFGGMRLIGRIYIDWKKNNVLNLIKNQDDSDNALKAEQFRTLKENFSVCGQYSDEDLSYLQFKRHEAKAELEEYLGNSKLAFLWAYPFHFVKQIILDRAGHYATNPARVILSMLVTLTLFSFIYFLLILSHAGDIIESASHPHILTALERGIYHSTITFFTIGYGDYFPDGVLRWISGLEGFTGVFLMSYFTVAFVRKILR